MTISQRAEQIKEQNAHFLTETSPAELREFIDDNLVTFRTGETTFNAIVHKGDDPESIILAPGEFGNGAKDAYGAILRLLYVRAALNPDASIALLPNSTWGENNTNFTQFEKKQLSLGSARPLVDRMNIVTEYLIADNEGDATVLGLSQGGVPALAFSAERKAAVAVLETPNVIGRTAFQLMKDFQASGGLLEETIKANFREGDAIEKTLIDALSAVGMAKYLAGCIKADNRALLPIMTQPSAYDAIGRTLARDGSVTHAWSEHSHVSPSLSNWRIAHAYSPYPRYETLPDIAAATHSKTNDYALVAALAIRADELRKNVLSPV